MLAVLVLLLTLLYVLGYLNVSFLSVFDFLKIPLFTVNGKVITALSLLILFTVLAALEVLPSPIREVAFGLLVLWVLSVLGIISIVWSANLLVVVMIGLLFLAIIMGK